jgi:hypothetical protein
MTLRAALQQRQRQHAAAAVCDAGGRRALRALPINPRAIPGVLGGAGLLQGRLCLLTLVARRRVVLSSP